MLGIFDIIFVIYFLGLAQIFKFCGNQMQARRQGGFEGVRSNPPFGPQKIIYTLL